MGYAEEDSIVRVDFFKPSGKWATTAAIDMNMYYNERSIFDALKLSLQADEHWASRYEYCRVVCLEPYHTNAHPIMLEPTKGEDL